MKILMSSIGTRGDVQPLLALALALRALGHESSLCVAPNFKDWVESYGLTCVPIGPDLKQFVNRPLPARRIRPTKAQRRQLAAQSVHDQFRVLSEAARGCDLLVGGGALQIAMRSIGESLDIPYIFAAYCPVSLPSPDHPPPKMFVHYPQWLPGVVNRALWRSDARNWNSLFGAALNEERAKLGLDPVRGVQRHAFTNRPWLAADQILAPAPAVRGMQIVQTGAWLPHDDTPLPDEVERFLTDGEPPVFIGFGSNRAPEQTGRMLVDAVRALHRRAIVSRGWTNLGSFEPGTDVLTIDDVNHRLLFPRVAAVVHHGGAGTTTTAACAGRPQLILPDHYDQFYWAHRVKTLGVGVEGPARHRLTVDALTAALRECLRAETSTRAQALGTRVRDDGAETAARRLVSGRELRDASSVAPRLDQRGSRGAPEGSTPQGRRS